MILMNTLKNSINSYFIISEEIEEKQSHGYILTNNGNLARVRSVING